ncbi:hypothetical protein [Streptomyces sp. NPDC059378]|uniref:hypothetical protein n=1 Tax=Streptomyces sp. NPDC059378 TaxID=3346815 RepID=UPI00368D58A2
MSAPSTGPLPEEPVAGGSRARRFRADRPAGRTAALLRLLRPRGRASRQETEPPEHPSVDLDSCRQELARWQHHADSFERELSRVASERAHLLAWLAALHPSSAVITPAVGIGGDGTHLLRLVAGERQLCWHLLPKDLPLFGHVPYTERSTGPLQRDGPGALEQAAHIRSHTRLLAIEGTLFAVPVEKEASARPAEH